MTTPPAAIPLVMFPVSQPRIDSYARSFGTPSPQLLDACQLALTARAATEVIRPRVPAMQVAVLEEHDFQVASHWKERGVPTGRMSDPAGAYEMEPERFAEYYAYCAAKYRAAGYEFLDQQCPLAIAEDVQAQVEKAFGLACKELRIELNPEEVLHYGRVWKDFLASMFGIVTHFLPPAEPGELRFNRA